MQTKPMPQTAVDLARDILARIAELEAWAAGLDASAGRAWVVLAAHELPLAFDVDGESVTNPRNANIEDATRFVRGRAQRLAMQCQNGKGEPSLAYPLPIAAERVIADMRETLAVIERAAA